MESAERRRLRRPYFQAVLGVVLLVAVLIGIDLVVRLAAAWEWRSSLAEHPQIQERWERTRELMPLATREVLLGDPRDMLAPGGGMVTRDRGANPFTTFGEVGADAFRTPLRRPDHDEAVQVAFFGGSTTWGPHGSLPGYPAFVQRRWDERYGPGVVRAVNVGIPMSSSATSAVLLHRFGSQIQPDIVVVYQGFNDLFFEQARRLAAGGEVGTSLTLDAPPTGLRRLFAQLEPRPREPVWPTAEAAYERFAALAEDHDAELWVSTFGHPDWALLDLSDRSLLAAEIRFLWPPLRSLTTYAADLAEYNGGLRRWAASSEVGLIDVERAHPKAMTAFADICHRRDEGLAGHAAAVVDALAPTLDRLVGDP